MRKLLLSGIIAVYGSLALAQTAPQISYPAAQDLYIGKSVSFLPTNTGGSIPDLVFQNVSTFAGTGASISMNGTLRTAGFYDPFAIAVDQNGNFYIAEYLGNRIRKISALGVVTILAGNSVFGYADGAGTIASFRAPTGIAVSKTGDVFVADPANNRIRKITADGMVSTLTGNGVASSVNGTLAQATFNGPCGITIDKDDNIYVAEGNGNRIRKITPSGMVTTIAGTGMSGRADGIGSTATFSKPMGIAVDALGNLFVSDNGTSIIRKITVDGIVSTYAGTGNIGYANGPRLSSTFFNPVGLTLDASGNLYIADQGNNMIRKISTEGVVSTLAGGGAQSFADGVGPDAKFYRASGVVAFGDKIYVADELNNRIRSIVFTGFGIDAKLPEGLVFDQQTGEISGTPTSVSAAKTYLITANNAYGSSKANVTLTTTIQPIAPVINDLSPKKAPVGATVTLTGSNFFEATGVTIGGIQAKELQVVSNTIIKAIVPEGVASGQVKVSNVYGSGTLNGFEVLLAPDLDYGSPKSYVTGTPINELKPIVTAGEIPERYYGQVATFAGNGSAGSANGIAALASFSSPCGLVTNAVGNVYVADRNNSSIRKITPDGTVSTLVSNISSPSALTIDKAGNLYTIEGSSTIRKISPLGAVTSIFTGMSGLFGLAVDERGDLFTTDIYTHTIRKVTQTGIVTIFAGSGSSGFTNGTGTAASFSYPQSIVIDGVGNLFVVDRGNMAIRKINQNGVVTTVIRDQTLFNSITGINGLAIDGLGNLYFANGYIVGKIGQDGVSTQVAGSTSIQADVNGIGETAGFYLNNSITIDPAGNMYVSDQLAHKIKKVELLGFKIDTALPEGLIFSASGNITGTPVKISPPQDHIITAYNLAGSTSATINMSTKIPETPPVITSLSQQSISYGRTVKIIGNNFLGLTSVRIGGVNTAFNIITPNLLAVKATSFGSIELTNQYGSISNPGITLAQAPAVTYTTPHTLVVGKEISDILPVNTGTAIPATAYAQVTKLAGNGTYGNTDGTGNAARFTTMNFMATDADGNTYLTQSGANTIRKITPAGVVTTLAGNGTAGRVNGPAASARFSDPQGIVVDAGGNVYVAESANKMIRKISPDGMVSTFAGSGNYGTGNGSGILASFSAPMGLAMDRNNNLYVCDQTANLIRKITPEGSVSTFAGSGNYGSTNGTGSNASFSNPTAIACDIDGNLYVTESVGNVIRKITPLGVVTTLAGASVSGKVDGMGPEARFNGLAAVTCDAQGNVYVADRYNNLIRKILPNGTVTTLAGYDGTKLTDGIGTQASFNYPKALATDELGNLLIADAGNYAVRCLSLTGYTISPALPSGLSFNSATGAISGSPASVHPASDHTVTGINSNGVSAPAIVNIEIKAPEVAPLISSISPLSAGAGNVVTITGSHLTNATLVEIGGVKASEYFIVSDNKISAVVAPGSEGADVKVTNAYGSNIFTGFTFSKAPAISYKTPVVFNTGVAASPLAVNNDGGIVPNALVGETSTFVGRTGSSSTSVITMPSVIVKDAAGNIYSASNNIIHKITPTGNITVLAGGAFGSVNGVGTAAGFYTIYGMAIDKNGNLYVTEGGSTIRKVTQLGNVTTYAGLNSSGTDDGPLSNATFNGARGLAFDKFGNLYVADAMNNKIRKISTDGIVSTFAGNKIAGSANGSLSSASFSAPQYLAFNDAGDLYLTEQFSNVIRKISYMGIVSVFAGSGSQGKANGKGTGASFNSLAGLSVDAAGNVYVADAGNHLIRKITPAQDVTTLAGVGVPSLINKVGLEAGFNNPVNTLVDNEGGIYVADKNNNAIRKVSLMGFAIDPLLPPGLAITGFGSITGTPTAIAAATSYAVTAYNKGGNNSFIVNIEVVTPKAAPTITAISPVSARAEGVVTITGTNLIGSTGVTIGGVPVLNYSVTSPTSIVAVVGKEASSGGVTVTNSYGDATLSGFTIISPPQISYNIPQLVAGTSVGELLPLNQGSEIPDTERGKVLLLAGTGDSGSNNGAANVAKFYGAAGITSDAAGNMYVADRSNHLIRKIDLQGNVTTVAGTGYPGNVNGTGTAASFNFPAGVAIDAAGNLYIADSNNSLVRKITPAGVVSTIAGNGSSVSTDGNGIAAGIIPTGIATDAFGNIYVSEPYTGKIRKITTSGTVTTLAGSGYTGAVNANGTAASFSSPNGITVDVNGNLYVADTYNNLIRKITPDGTVSTFAGSGSYASTDGRGSAAGFANPKGIAIDASGNLYVSEIYNRVRMITPDGVVTTLPNIGSNTTAFNAAVGLAINNVSGNLVIADQNTNVIWKMNVGGYIVNPALPTGLTLNSATGAITGTPVDVRTGRSVHTITAYNVNGNGKTDITIKVGYPAVPKISYPASQNLTAGTAMIPITPNNNGGGITGTGYGQITRVAGTGQYGDEVGPAKQAGFKYPSGLAIDAADNIYVTHLIDNQIRKISPDGIVTVYAGPYKAPIYAPFQGPIGLGFDSKGNLFVSDADSWDNKYSIKKITPGGAVSTFAGSGSGKANGVGVNASFFGPYQFTIDGSDNIYLADQGNNQIRKITPEAVVTTFAGIGAQGAANGSLGSASFYNPDAITINIDGNFYIADTKNNLIRKITPAGQVSTFAGDGAALSKDGIGTSASFNYPTSIVSDKAGNLYVADHKSNNIRKITTEGVVTTIAGSGAAVSVDGLGKYGSMNGPVTLLMTKDQTAILVAEYNGHIVSKVSLTGYSIDKLLPEGLSFDGRTGTISGIPTDASPATRYTITASNATGSSSATITLGVDPVSPPAISYIDKVLATNTPVSLQPSNTGGAVPANNYGFVTTIAGSTSYGNTDGIGSAAKFYSPTALVSDNNGNIYIADQYNNKIRKVTPDGVVSTFAGNGSSAVKDGTGAEASFSSPTGIAMNAYGDMYVVDRYNYGIRKVSKTGEVTTLDAIFYTPTGGLQLNYLSNPYGIAVDKSGNIYLSDQGNHVIRKITGTTTMSPSNIIATFAGMGRSGSVNGTGTNASFNTPAGIVTDDAGNLYVADKGNNQIRKITPDGTVTTFAGSNTAGLTDGTGNEARFNQPTGLTIDKAGNLFATDQNNNVIRMISPAGVVSTITGNGSSGSTDGGPSTATFNRPAGICIDPTGMIWVADQNNNLVRKVVKTGYTINRTLPDGLTFDSATGAINGTPLAAMPTTDHIITAYNYGGSGTTTLKIKIEPLQAPDIAYETPQRYSPDTAITPLLVTNKGGHIPVAAYAKVGIVAGSGAPGLTNGNAATATFGLGMAGAVVDASGNIYIADRGNNQIRKITPSGIVSTFAGSSIFAGSTNGIGVNASFRTPIGLAIDKADNLYVADFGNRMIRKITPAGLVTTLAGTGVVGLVNGSSTVAQFIGPIGITVDLSGNVYVADADLIRKITPSGMVSTFAGSTTRGFVNGIGSEARFAFPNGLACDNDGNIYVADRINKAIRKITPVGLVSTFAGNGEFGKVNGNLDEARFSGPTWLTVDAFGDLYVSDQGTELIRKITKAGIVSTVAGGYEGVVNEGVGTEVSFGQVGALSFDRRGGLIIVDPIHRFIKRLNLTGYLITPQLPAGLALDPATGTIAGIPTQLTPAKNYTVTGFNATGASATTVSIAIVDKNPSVITFDPLPAITYGDTNLQLAASSSNKNTPVAYKVDDERIATVIDGRVHIVGVGNTNITAIQPADDTHPVAKSVTQKLAVSPRAITISAIAQQKNFGDKDTLMPYVIENGALLEGDALTGNLVRIAGEDVGTYDIDQGTLSAGKNYDVTFKSNKLSISARPVTIAAESKSKVYGAADPELTYKVTDGDLIGTDVVTGKLSRKQGENVGTYAIEQGTLLLSKNYKFTFVEADLKVGQAKQVVTLPDLAMVSYNSEDIDVKATSNDVSSRIELVSDNVDVATIVNGKVHITGIGKATITAKQAGNSNFETAIPVSRELIVEPASLIITANEETRSYGDKDPLFTYTITHGKLVAGDRLDGSLTREPGEAAGSYKIGQGTLSTNKNYQITFIANKMNILPRAITVTADAKTKVYSTTDPALTFKITAGSLMGSDNFTGSLVRDAGETAGAYQIKKGTLTINKNYELTYAGAALVIDKAVLYITLNDKVRKYKEADPVFTFNYSGFVGGDGPGMITKPAVVNVAAHVNSVIGTYPITASGAESVNYSFVYHEAKLVIIPADRTITFDNMIVTTYGSGDVDLGGRSSTGDELQYSSSNTNYADIVGGKMRTKNAGSGVITASLPADPNYNPTSPVSVNFVIEKAKQSIQFARLPVLGRKTDRNPGSYDLSIITSTSGLPVNLHIADPFIASISGNTLTAHRIGETTITALQAGDQNHYPAVVVEEPVVVKDLEEGRDIIVRQAVSPNGDGLNDGLYIEGIDQHPRNTVALYNRGGVKVFEINNYKNGERMFDGRSNVNGARLSQGSYFYLIEYEGKRLTGWFIIKY